MAVLGAGSTAAAPRPYPWQLPPGFAPPQVPLENPMTEAKVALGKQLFFDTRLSATHGYACASCHQPQRAFTDGRIRAIGASGEVLAHQSMSLVNVAYAVSFGWTGGFDSLESQMHRPLFNRHPVELGLRGREAALINDFEADPRIRALFANAYPHAAAPVSIRHMIQAIASYERTLIFARSAFDRYIFDDDQAALSAGAKRGMALFFGPRLGCAGCHFGLNLAGPAAIAGRPRPAPIFADTGTQGRFKVPGLRNVARTAPYMHDGRYADLPAVIDHYERLDASPSSAGSLDPRLHRFHLTAEEKQDLIDFLNSLSDLSFGVPAPSG